MKQDFAKATSYSLRITPRKVKLVIDLVKGKSIPEALAILENLNRKASRDVAKVIKSAAANAVKNHEMVESKLFVFDLRANEGSRDKRMMPRAKGSGNQILKRKTHLWCVVKER